MNRIDLSKFNIRSDLIVESLNNKDYIEEKKDGNIKVSKVIVDKNNKDIINKKEGFYITIEFEDITNYEDRENVGKCLEQEIRKLLDINGIKTNDDVMVIGLGNIKSTADSLGPKVIENILVTRHLFSLNTNVKDKMRSVCAISPGVMGTTGLETSDVITSIISKIKPKFVIIIDSLCACNVERLNKTVQLTDTGIYPGSGVGVKIH